MMKGDISKIIADLKKKKGVTVLQKGSKDKSPQPLSYNDSRSKFVPDYVVQEGRRQDFYAVEDKITASNLPNLISKWILFSIQARMNAGDFYLVVKGEKEGKKCQTIIDNKQLSIKLIVQK